MTCSFRDRNNNQCKNLKIGNSIYCHLRSHYPDLNKYWEIVDKLRNQFELSTISLNDFRIHNITSDGACAFRCMIRALYDVKNFYILVVKHESEYTDKLINLIKKYPKLNLTIERELANLIQQIIREWIIDNKDRIIENMDYTLENFIMTCHEFESIEDYNELYKIFSGDDDYIKIETDKIYKKGKNQGKHIVKKVEINDRWGGSPELYAFCNIFNLKLSVYVLKKFNDKTCKVVKGSVKGLPSRLKLWQTFNNEFNGSHVNFLLTDKQNSHYNYLESLETVNKKN